LAQPEKTPHEPRYLKEKFSVKVHRVPVRDLLFALARDANLDIDIAPGITGLITMNAVEQNLPTLLTRIARQTPLRFEFTGGNLLIQPDTPYLRHYPVDYVNLARSVNGAVSNNMQIGASSANSIGAGSLSNTRIENTTQHRFWETLEKNLRQLLLERGPSTFAVDPAEGEKTPGSGNESNSTLIINPEAGLVSLLATHTQHQGIKAFIEHVGQAVRRQVLIEATIVEVALSEGHEQGIDWNGLVRGGLFELAGNSLKGSVNLRYNRNDDPRALISLLDSFGTSRVLSSPRISVLNNQSALLKVVENYVYFTVKADTTTTANVGTTVTYTTTPQTVSVGLVMGVTPQISADDSVVLNIRPTITSIGREIPDPNPDLRKNGIENLVPMIRTREIESVMRVSNGQIAVLGGLMEDRINHRNNRLPLLGEIPIAGELFNNRNNQAQKTELVIFLRPVVIREASLAGEFSELSRHLPDSSFFQPQSKSFGLPAPSQENPE
jgi:MSHA type pilus biogenesis protein MshL